MPWQSTSSSEMSTPSGDDDIGEVWMPVDEFIQSCKEGHFNDHDGQGFFGNGTTYNENRPVVPSTVGVLAPLAEETHVCWFGA